jgi:hypothetical protein
MNTSVTLAKIATLPKILEAAKLLFELGLIDELPAAVVKRYVLANPDINEFLGRPENFGRA